MWLLQDGSAQAGLPCAVAGLRPCGRCGMAAYRPCCLALWLGLGALWLLWDGSGNDSGLVDAAHARGLQVHAWTFRDDRAPAPFDSSRDELFAAFALGVDALFCDFPDTAVAARADYEAGIARHPDVVPNGVNARR